MPDRADLTKTCRRRVRRYRLNPAEVAFVAFDAAGGSHWKLNVLEISAEGFAFELDNGRPAMAVGTNVDAVRIEVASLRIAGSMRVAHVTEETETDTVCGVEFAPFTEADTLGLASLIDRLEARDRRTG